MNFYTNKTDLKRIRFVDINLE